MTYTKRWELIHLLGGKCMNCGNENFYDLEVHHKFDDGDGDRAFYKDVIGHYLSKPIRAKMCSQPGSACHNPNNETTTNRPSTAIAGHDAGQARSQIRAKPLRAKRRRNRGCPAVDKPQRLMARHITPRPGRA